MENPKVAGSAAVDSSVVGEAGTLSADTLQKSGMPHQSDFSLLRVVFMVLILGAIGAAGWYLLIREGKPPALVPYTGRVLYQGKPVVGSVMTQNLDDVFDSAGGDLDEDGRFTLDTNGEPGANVGRHKLAIVSFERGAPGLRAYLKKNLLKNGKKKKTKLRSIPNHHFPIKDDASPPPCSGGSKRRDHTGGSKLSLFRVT